MPKKLKIFSLKIHKGAAISKERQNFLNKSIKRKKNDMEGLNLEPAKFIFEFLHF